MFTAIAAESTPPNLVALAEALDAAFQRGELGVSPHALIGLADGDQSNAKD